jgi:hypothetical protein
MAPWVAIVDDATAAEQMAAYEPELDETYVSYSGGTELTAQGDYVRIDGPGGVDRARLPGRHGHLRPDGTAARIGAT